MKKVYLLLLSVILLMNIETSAQCTNTSQWPFSTIAINPTGASTQISSCSFAGEYSVISGAVNGQTLRFTSNVGTDEITIRSGSSSGPVIAFGTTPLVFANTYTGTIYAHWNTPGCGSESNCRITTVQCTSCTVPPPANDLCSGAISIACGQTINASTATATADPVGTCGTSLGSAPGVWYTFVGDGATNVLSLCGSSYDTKIGVFSGSCASLTCVAGNDDFCGLSSQVTVATTPGTTYYVLVTGFSSNSGNFTLSRTCGCTGVPSPGVITGPSGTVCFGAPATLTLNGYTTGLGISIQWKSSSTPGGPYTNIAGATASTYSASPAATTYYVATVSCSSSGFNATTAEFALNISRPVHSNVLATPATGCAPASTVITGTVSGGVTSGNYTHLLTGPATITQNASSGPNNSNASFTVSNMPAGTHVFTLRSTDAAGCFVTSNVTVVVNPTPVITITPTAATFCNGTIQKIDAFGSPNIQQSFTNLTNIHTPAPPTTSGIATPYPSGIVVSGMPATGTSVNSVTLSTYYHFSPDDVDVVLVSPTGQSVILMSDCGGTASQATGQTFVLSDAAASFLADNSFNASGTYKPTNYDAVDNWPAPGPGSAPTATTLSTFTGDLNGTWRLYVVDDNTGAAGLISSWSMSINLPAPVVFSPITNLFTDAAATVPYTGTPVYTVWAKPTATTTYTASYTSGGCTGSATSVLTVNQLPAITAQPVAVAASCPGFNVNYSVTATGTGLTYQWQVSTNGGSTWTNLTNSPLTYSGVTTNALTVINPQASQDNSQYRVIVSGTCAPSVTSSAVTMRIGNPPTITSISTNPAVPTICQGSNISFTVVAAGSPIAPTIYQWQVSTNGGSTWTNLTTGGSYTSVFTITGAATAQTGSQYRVIVTNPCGQSVTSAVITLTVNALPVVTAAPLTNRICISDTLVPLTGTPAGGSWTGLGTSGNNFIPSATGIGTFPIRYTAASTAGCVNTSTINVKVEDCAERIRRLKDNGVLVYPNPNGGRFNIKVNSTLYNYLGMRVYNTAGETVWTQYFNSLVYARVVPVNLSQLPNGAYIVKIFYDDGIRTSEKSFRLVIQK